ncbi:hypothetical protein [Streptomyces cyaneofuscatus]|uniref:hypothetical protein n=1 Tax=Streptomyces cyaneofuscatus TaxID=66883 RepID=UPI0036385F30
MANMRWLSRYRRPRCGRRQGIADLLVKVFDEPVPLRAGTAQVGDPLVVLPALFHLLWSGVLAADVAGRLLDSDSLVHTAGRR